MSWWSGTCGAIFALFVTLGPAQADGPPSASALRYAEEIATSAIALHQRGEYARAAEKFLEAYALSGRAAQLWNAAKSYDLAGDVGAAVRTWERYLARDDVDPGKKAQAAARVAELRAREPPLEVAPDKAPEPRAPHTVEEVPAGPRAILSPVPAPSLAPSPPPVVTPSPLAPPPPPVVIPSPVVAAAEPTPVLGYALVGGGALAAVGGGILFFSGWQAYWSSEGSPGTITYDDARGAQLRSGVGIAVGAAGLAVVTAALLFAFDAGEP